MRAADVTVAERFRATVRAYAGAAIAAVVLWPRCWPLAAYALAGCYVLDRAAAALDRATR